MESDHDEWMAPLDPATLDEFSCLTIRGFQGFVHTEQLEDDKPDSAPSNLIPDLAGFTADELKALYERLLEQVAEMHFIYARLLSHLDVASKISTETESLLRGCFFQQHNLAAQFEMYGMHRCARHLRQVEAKLALFPPIYNQYQLYNLSTEASQQMERLWLSPALFHQLVGTYQVHLEKLPLSKWNDIPECHAFGNTE
jgi:hypothetical protein